MAVKGDMDQVQLAKEQAQMVEDFMKAHPEVNRSTALKFNLGRKFVIERVEECYANYQRTVLEHHFEAVTVADVLDELRTQKLYLPGTRDRSGAAIFIINAAKHVPGQYSNEQTLKLAFYMGEVLTSSPKTSQIGVTIISNMEGIEWANFDNQFQRTIIEFFQNNIPARVKNIILYKSPWWISMLVRMMSPFLKQKIRERIHLCEEGDLNQFVESDQLPQELGGTLQYDHGTFIRREMAKVPSAALLKSQVPSFVQSRPNSPLDEGVDGILRKAPPGTIMLVSDELAEALNIERKRVLTELDEKIRRRRASLHQHTLPLDIGKIVRSRARRMTLDLSALPSLEPNLLHLRGGDLIGPPSSLVATEKSPLKERPGEDYDPVKLEKRIASSMRKDRSEFLRGMDKENLSLDHQGIIEEEIMQIDRGSVTSFVPPKEETVPPVPQLPKPKTQFTKLVPVAAPPSNPTEFQDKSFNNTRTDLGNDGQGQQLTGDDELSLPGSTLDGEDTTLHKRKNRRTKAEGIMEHRNQTIFPSNTNQVNSTREVSVSKVPPPPVSATATKDPVGIPLITVVSPAPKAQSSAESSPPSPGIDDKVTDGSALLSTGTTIKNPESEKIHRRSPRISAEDSERARRQRAVVITGVNELSPMTIE